MGIDKRQIKTDDKLSVQTRNLILKRMGIRKKITLSIKEQIELTELRKLIKKKIREDVIECTVCMQQLHYPLSKSCICGTVCNFDSIISKVCMCLENGPMTGDSEYGPYWIDSVCVISNASFDEIT